MPEFEKPKSWGVLIIAILSLGATFLILRLLPGSFFEMELRVLGVVTFNLLFCIGLYAWYFRKLRFPRDIKPSLMEWSEWKALAPLCIALVPFAVASVYLVYYPIAYVWPDFVDGVLRDLDATLGNKDSYNPVFYNTVLIVAATTIVPVVEEVVFRGILYSAWKAKFGHFKALLGSSLLFSVLHSDIIGAFVASLVLFTLVLKTGSLAVPIIFHAVYNLLALAIGPLLNEITGSVQGLTLTIFREYVWLGTACFVVSTPVIAVYLFKNRNLLRKGPQHV